MPPAINTEVNTIADCLEIDPSVLKFKDDYMNQEKCTIAMVNKLRDKYVTYQIFCTSPTRYIVTPKSGRIKPDCTKFVEITRKLFDSRVEYTVFALQKQKFIVQYYPIKLNSRKQQIVVQEKKIPCLFSFPTANKRASQSDSGDNESTSLDDDSANSVVELSLSSEQFEECEEANNEVIVAELPSRPVPVAEVPLTAESSARPTLATDFIIVSLGISVFVMAFAILIVYASVKN